MDASAAAAAVRTYESHLASLKLGRDAPVANFACSCAAKLCSSPDLDVCATVRGCARSGISALPFPGVIRTISASEDIMSWSAALRPRAAGGSWAPDDVRTSDTLGHASTGCDPCLDSIYSAMSRWLVLAKVRSSQTVLTNPVKTKPQMKKLYHSQTMCHSPHFVTTHNAHCTLTVHTPIWGRERRETGSVWATDERRAGRVRSGERARAGGSGRNSARGARLVASSRASVSAHRGRANEALIACRNLPRRAPPGRAVVLARSCGSRRAVRFYSRNTRRPQYRRYLGHSTNPARIRPIRRAFDQSGADGSGSVAIFREFFFTSQ